MESSPAQVSDVLNDGDALVEKQKAFIRKADLIQYLSLIIYAVGFSVFLAFAHFKLIQAAIFILLVLDSAILFLAALRIR